MVELREADVATPGRQVQDRFSVSSAGTLGLNMLITRALARSWRPVRAGSS